MNNMDNNNADLFASLIRKSTPERLRMKEVAMIGFNSRLLNALSNQSPPLWSAWEVAARRSLQIAAVFTALILFQAGLAVIPQGFDLVQTEWMLERIFIGI